MTDGSAREHNEAERIVDREVLNVRHVARTALVTALALAIALHATVPPRSTAAPAPAKPAFARAFHRSGQTFITWGEDTRTAGERYRVYRSTAPITRDNLAAAALLYELPEDSGRFYADRYNVENSGVWAPRYFDRFVITARGRPLSPGTGLLVWTLSPDEVGGLGASTAFYAVTTVKSGLESEPTPVPSGVRERVAPPRPLEILAGDGGRGHVFTQFMDLHVWNPTFNAPHPNNQYFGLDPRRPAIRDALQYAYTYAVGEPDPANCGGRPPRVAALILNLHGHVADSIGPDVNAAGYYCAFEIRPIDVHQTWFFGFAREHDYRTGGMPSIGDTIVNYTEYRVLRMIYDLLRHPTLGPRIDTERIYVYGHSMGGSGALAFAMRYPRVFAAAYASEPMTDYATSGDGGGVDWREDVRWKWGDEAANLPVEIVGPSNWAAPLRRYDGTGVWDWQDHQHQLRRRVRDEMVPVGIAHGRQDDVIEWSTQGRPVYDDFDASRRAWGGQTVDAGHGWLGFTGLPPTIAPDRSLWPFYALQVIRSETVPALSGASGDGPLPPPNPAHDPAGYNQGIEWSASWLPWDGAPVDSADSWGVSLRTIDGSSQTVDVTPRRLQRFRPRVGVRYRWEDRRIADGALVTSGTITTDRFGLLTVPDFRVTPGGNRLRITVVADAPSYAPGHPVWRR